ncbi:hypothetical protein J2S34_003510 [Nitrobacter winogradskyi]|uniref:Uncharacterized protein n=1 Tax=Nitrobacter winogradskyi TaxID=913 RepID=A0ACC6APC9_NITWI|nr:hypothetical protein [Nitrobacter winogradskyi]
MIVKSDKEESTLGSNCNFATGHIAFRAFAVEP